MLQTSLNRIRAAVATLERLRGGDSRGRGQRPVGTEKKVAEGGGGVGKIKCWVVGACLGDDVVVIGVVVTAEEQLYILRRV